MNVRKLKLIRTSVLLLGLRCVPFSYLAIMQMASPSLPTQTARKGESAEPPVAV